MDFPPPLQVYPLVEEPPNLGKSLILWVTWVSNDHKEGYKWIEKISSLGKCVMVDTKSKTAHRFVEENKVGMPDQAYGKASTLSFKEVSDEIVQVLAKYSKLLPTAQSLVAYHTLRNPESTLPSVFGNQQTHYMLEIMPLTYDTSEIDAALAWSRAFRAELIERGPENVLTSSYISLQGYDDMDNFKIFHKHLPLLRRLKKKYDPLGVFKFAAPRNLDFGEQVAE